jgi:hypothetical protein
MSVFGNPHFVFEAYLPFCSRGPLRIKSDQCSIHSSKLRAGFLLGKTFSAFTDLLKDPFQLLHLFWRDILEGTFDECCMPTKEREECLPPFFSQRHGSYPTIFAALYAADKSLLEQTIHRDAY